VTTIVQTDEQFLADAAAGDQAAFGQLFDRHVKAVYNHCFRLSASWTTAEDATQATFLTAWRKHAEIRLVGGSALPWLLAVASNVVRDERRSARRWFAAVLRLPPERDDADIADLVAGRIDDEERMRAVLREARRLPRAEREALALCLWSSVPYADAASLLGITEASVRARVSRARARLARYLGDAAAPALPTLRETT
jgi:RNA polymerase sigma factor (sigma-70 family)